MKKLSFILLASLLCIINIGYSQIYLSNEAANKIPGTALIAYEKGKYLPCYIKLRQGYEINYSNWQQWISKVLDLSPEMGFSLLNVQQDSKGEMHYRFIQTNDNIPIQGTMLIVHTKNEFVYAFNGEVISSLNISSTPFLKETEALSSALSYVNASTYKWEVPAEEEFIKSFTKDASATYYPKGNLFYVEDIDNNIPSYKLSYRFDIYADAPLKRSYIFVDAEDGKILCDLGRIHTTDVPGIAVTKYSGNQTIITDSTGASSYRLRETGRGNGIETYNMQTGTSYGSSVDFTDSDNYWNNVNAAEDEIATDAHWGAEMTYDYFYNNFGRNSIDGNGFKLMSYVHYDVDYDNAFWDGQRMTYGDGSSYNPFTALDICGHEITHGLDEMTANLNYQDESGALNEGFSDIFGCAIEFYARPSNANWNMGEDIGSILRSLATPKLYQCPNTYLGNFWYTGTGDNGGVHTNSGVIGYWYYLLSDGGSGTNDNGIAYNITGLGIDDASAIAYRTLTVYLTNTSEYSDARFYSILAAIDLYGPCTPQVETVADAWYACGVGGPYDSTVTADFSASFNTFCSFPATVHFTNNSSNSNVFEWDFGDGSTSTDMNPDHTYTSYGDFTVTLISSGGSCGTDTLIETSFISVDTLNPCITVMPQGGTMDNQNSCAGILFDSGGDGNYQDNTNSSVTIQPPGASYITLTFTAFGFESGYDFLKIYDGPTTMSPLIGSYSGNTLPNGGTINSTYGAITIVQTSDIGLTDIGFICEWQCNYPTTPPLTNFKVNDTLSCTGNVLFTDLTTNGPTSWFWDFGDGDTSVIQYPQHLYLNDGSYTVTLITSNALGSDTLEKPFYVNVDKPEDPTADSAWRCSPGSLTLTGIGSDNLQWYDAAVGGNLVFAGDTFVTPYLNNTTTYYVQDVVPAPSQFVGPADNTFGGGGYYTYSAYRYLVFDCFTPIRLASVLVYANTAGIRTIDLNDASGNLLMDTSINIPVGETRLYLNFDIPPGTGYQLAANSGSALYRNQNGANFPYEIPGMISITGTNASTTSAYYFFYDWEITGGNCSSNRIPSLATIYLPSPAVDPSGEIQICDGQSVTLTCENAESYLWYPGNETTQSIDVDAAGSFYVMVTDSICATSSDTITVDVVSNPPIAGFSSVENYLAVTFTNTTTNGDTFWWDFGDGSSSQISDPSHTYAAAGTYTIMLVAENVCGTDTFTTTITVNANGISESTDNSRIQIYPNPTDGMLNIDLSNLDSDDNVNYSVYDLIGNVVKAGTIGNSGRSAHTVIKFEEFSKGIYYIRLFNESMNSSCKIIIQ